MTFKRIVDTAKTDAYAQHRLMELYVVGHKKSPSNVHI